MYYLMSSKYTTMDMYQKKEVKTVASCYAYEACIPVQRAQNVNVQE